jgi:hypothetical protein
MVEKYQLRTVLVAKDAPGNTHYKVGESYCLVKSEERVLLSI